MFTERTPDRSPNSHEVRCSTLLTEPAGTDCHQGAVKRSAALGNVLLCSLRSVLRVLLWSTPGFFLKENVSYPVWICIDPIFYDFQGPDDNFLFLGTRIGSLKRLKKNPGQRHSRQPRWVPAIVTKRHGTRNVNVQVLPQGPILETSRQPTSTTLCD